jgi:predicted protein tyrosine phosphatase
MPVKITSLQNAPKHYDWADFVVSTLEFRRLIQGAGKHRHLILSFEDTELEHEQDAPQMWHVERAFRWLEERGATSDSKLLFHCHAGVSRSSAMAWSSLVSLGVPIDDAFQMIVQGADARIWPNLLIIRHADAILGKNGDFVKFAEEMDAKIRSERNYGIYGGQG